MSEVQEEVQGLKYRLFKCDKCNSNRVFYTTNELQEHYTQIHPTSEPFIASPGASNGLSKLKEDTDV